MILCVIVMYELLTTLFSLQAAPDEVGGAAGGDGGISVKGNLKLSSNLHKLM